ncbi:MAG: hypothetical protein AAFU80_24125 [Pseudomonadota bacterium]
MSAPPAAAGPELPGEIGPSTRKNPVPTILCAGVAVLLAVMSWQVWRLTEGGEPGAALFPLLASGLTAAFGWYLWRAQPFVQGRLLFEPQGMRVAKWGTRGRPVPEVAISWSDFALLRHTEVPRAPDKIVLSRADGTRLALDGHGFEVAAPRVVDAILAHAVAAGCKIEQRGAEHAIVTNRTWEVTPPP